MRHERAAGQAAEGNRQAIEQDRRAEIVTFGPFERLMVDR